MKRLLWTVALLTAFVFTMNAQNNYARLWSKVQKAEKEGKPQTAAGYLKELEEATIRNGDELEQLVVSEALYNQLREYNWKEANAYYPKFSALNQRMMRDSLDAYAVKYKDHPRVMKLLFRQLENHKQEVDRRRRYGATGADYLRIRQEASELLKHKYVGTYRGSIQSVIDGMDSHGISTSHHETMAPSDTVPYTLYTRNVRAVEYKVYRLLDDRLFQDGFKDSSEETLRKNATLLSTQSFRDFTCDYNIDEEHKVTVAFPLPGVYVVRFTVTEARDPKTVRKDSECCEQVFVSNVAGAMRLREGRAEVYAADWHTGKPFGQGKVNIYKNLYKSAGSAILRLNPWKTDRFQGEGFQAIDAGKAVGDTENSYMMRIEAGDDRYAPLFGQFWHPYVRPHRYERVVRYEQARIFTDRALYKPTDSIHFKILCFKSDQTKGEVSAGVELRMTLRHQSEDKPVDSLQLVTGEMGSAAGVFTLPEGAKNGIYILEAEGKTMKRIRVEEYKRPTFTVSLQPIAEPMCYGDVVKQGGQVRSYAGFSVSGSEVWYRIRRTTYSRTNHRYLGNDLLMEGTVISDGDGRFEVAFPAERPYYKDYENDLFYSTYDIVVQATDPQGETHETSISVPVADIPVELEVRLPDNEHFEDRLIVDKDHVKAVTVGGSTLNGTPYVAPVTWQVTDAEGREVTAGSCTANEAVAFDFGSLPSGDYVLKARTEFRGREITAERKVVVLSTDDRKLPFKSTYFYYPVKTEGAIEFVLGTTEDDLYLELELFDNDKQLYRESVHLQNEMRKFVLPYKDSYRSAVKMSVFGIREGRELDYTYQFTRPGDVRLDVAVETFRDKTTPGSEETMVVRAPAGSELAVSIYDVTSDRYGANSFSFHPLSEYVSISRPDIVTSLFGGGLYYARNEAMMMKTAGAVLMRDDAAPMALEDAAAVESEESAADQDGGGTGEETPDFEARSNFSELIAFYPQIQADPSGRTEIRYKAGDLLSTFRILVLAHDKRLFVGDAAAEFVVQKELMVLPNVPLFVTEGDRLVLKSKLVNLSSRELKGTAYIELRDANGKKLRLKGLESQKRALLAGAQDEVSWTVEVPGGTSKLTAKIWFATPTSSDGEQHEITVVPATVTLTEAASFILGGKHDHKYYEKQLRKQFGAANPKIEYAEYSTLDAVKESLPQAAKPASDNAIAWTNQLYINQMRNYVLADDAADYQPFRKQAFSKLKTFQHSDGGLQWFPGMESSTMVTLYFLEKAGQLRSVGAFTPEEDELKLICRALDYIDGRIALQGTYKEFRPFTLIRDFAVRSLWFDIPMREDAAAVYKRFIDGTEEGWQKISILEKSQLINTLLRAGKTPYDDKRFARRVKLLRESLKDYAVENPTVGCYFPNAVMPFRGLMNSEIYAHAQLIETFGRLGEKKMVDGIAQWLLLQKHNQAWENTVATTDAVHALVSSKAKDLRLGAVYYTYTTRLDRVQASANELSVTRTFVNAKTGAVLSDGEPLHVGDEIIATYAIYNSENRSFVQMRAMRPACFYPRDERSYFTWYGYYREVKPSETNYYWELLPEEHITVQERFYVQQEGTFNSGLVEIECLYAREYRGHTDAVTLNSK